MPDNAKPVISVLMGAYNVAATLGKSIESIQAQSFQNWELLICDDGSKDETFKVASEYAAGDSRIHVIKSETNHGLSHALNQCLNMAAGEFCARMDGDDLCDPQRFQKQLDFLHSHSEYAFVSTTMKRFDEHGIYSDPGLTEGYAPQKANFIAGSPFTHAPVLMRTEAYRKVGGYREIPQVLGVEDYDLWFRLYAQGFRGYMLGEPLYSMFDGRDAAHRRSFKRRMNEYWVRKNGYALIGIPWWKRFYMFKPIVLACIPQWLYRLIRPL